ncbi:hypothetical protein Nepgr_016574 [Nepenthes gracilis]|uniref:Major facilitator superfamily (MFS) profile domain-containing protein n=1 Tax=Nepenthes gracilis TaxID=150966 RepID=A0AAD3SMZ2_NEPGR|nr:hypothetical protein Nepgr_016574 [Nepenthes gracilis]
MRSSFLLFIKKSAKPLTLDYLIWGTSLLCAASLSPSAGVLVIHHDRPAVLAMGTVCWAFSTAAVGASQHFAQVAFWRAVNGFGLAIVIPVLQSFITDSYLEGVRGVGFEMLSLVCDFGGIGGGVSATIISGHQY